VLAITNLIMEELLGEDRDPRAFRAKFPEEVLQENLAGQLWFGAECLAAGSSIMNRETESKEMRPLAQAVTKSLGNVRVLLRDQCLKNNVPNSKTLHLDLNDSTTEQLYESLKIFDRLFAEFELSYVSHTIPQVQRLPIIICCTWKAISLGETGKGAALIYGQLLIQISSPFYIYRLMTNPCWPASFMRIDRSQRWPASWTASMDERSRIGAPDWSADCARIRWVLKTRI